MSIASRRLIEQLKAEAKGSINIMHEGIMTTPMRWCGFWPFRQLTRDPEDVKRNIRKLVKEYNIK